jgi:hypothetical protein
LISINVKVGEGNPMPYRIIFAIAAATTLGMAYVTSGALAFRGGSHASGIHAGAAGGARAARVSALPITVPSIAVPSTAVPSTAVPSTAVLSIAVPPHIAVTVPASPRVSVREQRVPQRPVQQRQARITTLLAAILRTRPVSKKPS